MDLPGIANLIYIQSYATVTGHNPVFGADGTMVGWLPAYNTASRQVTFLPQYSTLLATGGLFRYFDFWGETQYIQVAPTTGAGKVVTPPATGTATTPTPVPGTTTPAVQGTPTPVALTGPVQSVNVFGKPVPVAYLAIGGAAVLALLVLNGNKGGGYRR